MSDIIGYSISAVMVIGFITWVFWRGRGTVKFKIIWLLTIGAILTAIAWLDSIPGFEDIAVKIFKIGSLIAVGTYLVIWLVAWTWHYRIVVILSTVAIVALYMILIVGSMAVAIVVGAALVAFAIWKK